MDKLNKQRETLENKLKCAREREKRARLNGATLVNELRQKNLLSEELSSKLEKYSGN